MNTDLPPCAEEVDHLLHRARAVHVERDRNEVLRDALADDVALVVGRVLQELLAEIVAEGICGCGGMDKTLWSYGVNGVENVPVIRSAK